METPIRDQIRLDNLWQAQRPSLTIRRVFIPAPWAGSEIDLISPNKVALVNNSQPVTFGAWNWLEGNATLEGAKIVALPPLHIKRIDWTQPAKDVLSVQVELSKPEVCTLYVTLSESDGSQVSSIRLPIKASGGGICTRVSLPVPPVAGRYRLKVVVEAGGQITDNVRVEVI